jgi:hypothetical protein
MTEFSIDHDASKKAEADLNNLGISSADELEYMLWMMSKCDKPKHVCCYCERILTSNPKSPTYGTREHVIPKKQRR